MTDQPGEGSSQIQKVLLALVLRGGGLGLQIGMSIAIARLLGAEGMGLYTVYVTWMVLLADLVSFGLPVYLLRSVSSLKAVGAAAAAPAYVQRTLGAALGISLPLLLVPVLAPQSVALLVTGKAEMAPVIQLAALAAWLFLGMRLLAEALKAGGSANQGLFVESAIIPLVVLGGVPFFVLQGSPDTITLIWTHMAGVATAALCAWLLWRRLSRHFVGEGNAPPVLSPALWPLWGGTLLNVVYVNLPLLLLPYFVDTATLGQFSVAFRLVNLATVILVTLAAIFGPRFAAAHASGDTSELRLQLKRSQQFSLILFSPLLLAFAFFADPILALFGDEFTDARLLLWIMAAGQFVNAATGLVGYMLNMMHREQTELHILLGTGIAMVLAMILGAQWAGVLGLTIAYSGGLMMKNLLSLLFAVRHLRRMGGQESR